MKKLILFFLLIMLSLAFVGCQQRVKEPVTIGESSEEAEITSGLTEIEEINSLEDDFDLSLEELDAMNYK